MKDSLIKKFLKNLKKDYLLWNCYREDSIKACLYFHIRNHFSKQNKKREIFIFPEIRNFLYKKENETKYKERFDLVISSYFLENCVENEEDIKNKTDIDWYDSIKEIIEIKYIKWTITQIYNALKKDFNKLAILDENKNIEKNLFFIFEHNSKNIENLKNNINTNLNNIEIKIFWLFVNLDENYKVSFFKDWEILEKIEK